MKVLEFKHIGPFPGCYSRWEYIGVDEEGKAYPIVFTPKHLMPETVMGLTVGTTDPDLYPLYSLLFKDFTWLEWNEELFDEVPYNYIPAFVEFAERQGLEFIWYCGECGEPQATAPTIMADWYGNGGANIEATGWLCENCAYSQWAREHYAHLQEEKV